MGVVFHGEDDRVQQDLASKRFIWCSALLSSWFSVSPSLSGDCEGEGDGQCIDDKVEQQTENQNVWPSNFCQAKVRFH